MLDEYVDGPGFGGEVDVAVGFGSGVVRRKVEHRRVVRWVREETRVYSTTIEVILLNCYCRDLRDRRRRPWEKVRKKAKK